MSKYVLRVEDELWREFKSKVSRNETINDVLVRLIREYVGKEPTDDKKEVNESGVQSKKQQSVKSGARKYFNRSGKQLVLIKTSRFYGDERKEVIAVGGDALDIPDVRHYVVKVFKWDDKYDDYVRSYSDTAYEKIKKELFGLAKKYGFFVQELS